MRLPAGFVRAGNGRGFLAGWLGLGRFWLIVVVVCGAAGGVVQWLGPPHAPDITASSEAAQPSALAQLRKSDEAAAVHEPPLVLQQRVARPADAPGRDQPGPIADPDPSLLEPAGPGSKDMLPRIAADGRPPMQVYAAGFDRTSRRPRIAILMAGIGLSEADSLNAARTLPGAVTFAVSPYGGAVPRALAAARMAQHEYLLSIPMEPEGFPLSDPGNQALMTNLSRADNMTRLLWAMSRFAGYAGVTGALGDLRGERFAGLSDQMEPVLQEIARRGLLYVDPRIGQSPSARVWSRGVDLTIDDPPSADAIEQRLAELEKIARQRGSALGLAGAPRPVTVERIASWVSGLPDRGLALAPVSAIVQAPPQEAHARNAAPKDPTRTGSTSKSEAE